MHSIQVSFGQNPHLPCFLCKTTPANNRKYFWGHYFFKWKSFGRLQIISFRFYLGKIELNKFPTLWMNFGQIMKLKYQRTFDTAMISFSFHQSLQRLWYIYFKFQSFCANSTLSFWVSVMHTLYFMSTITKNIIHINQCPQDAFFNSFSGRRRRTFCPIFWMYNKDNLS